MLDIRAFSEGHKPSSIWVYDTVSLSWFASETMAEGTCSCLCAPSFSKPSAQGITNHSFLCFPLQVAHESIPALSKQFAKNSCSCNDSLGLRSSADDIPRRNLGQRDQTAPLQSCHFLCRLGGKEGEIEIHDTEGEKVSELCV